MNILIITSLPWLKNTLCIPHDEFLRMLDVEILIPQCLKITKIYYFIFKIPEYNFKLEIILRQNHSILLHSPKDHTFKLLHCFEYFNRRSCYLL